MRLIYTKIKYGGIELTKKIAYNIALGLLTLLVQCTDVLKYTWPPANVLSYEYSWKKINKDWPSMVKICQYEKQSEEYDDPANLTICFFGPET